MSVSLHEDSQKGFLVARWQLGVVISEYQILSLDATSNSFSTPGRRQARVYRVPFLQVYVDDMLQESRSQKSGYPYDYDDAYLYWSLHMAMREYRCRKRKADN